MWAGVICVLAFLAVASWAQSPYSARAGLIFHVEGKAQVVGESKSGSGEKLVQHLEAGQHLRTAAGRVEVILAPGLILRAGGDTEFEMVKPHLSDLRVRLISGSAILHVVRDSYLGSLSVLSGDTVVKFQKLGVYRLDVPAEKSLGLKVFGGQAVVSANGFEHKVKKKWSLELADPASRPLLAQFDRSQRDSLDEWHRERTAVIETALRERKKAMKAKQGRVNRAYASRIPRSSAGLSSTAFGPRLPPGERPSVPGR